MKVTWLGQAGLLFEKKGFKILVDPYLSDSVKNIDAQKARRIPVEESFLKIHPNIIICTHNHLDHTDPDTLCHYLNNEQPITVLASALAWAEIRNFGGNHNYVQLNRHSEWSQNGLLFRAVKAEHSDAYAIGVLIVDGEKTYYITGDTVYSTEIFNDIDTAVDVLFLPINGVGNNMNMVDAKRFCERICPKQVVPLHFGLFDTLDPSKLDVPNRIIPEIYKAIPLSLD